MRIDLLVVSDDAWVVLECALPVFVDARIVADGALKMFVDAWAAQDEVSVRFAERGSSRTGAEGQHGKVTGCRGDTVGER